MAFVILCFCVTCIYVQRAHGAESNVKYSCVNVSDSSSSELKPNSVPVVGGFVLLQYTNGLSHAAKILEFVTNGIVVIEGAETSDGKCANLNKEIPYDSTAIKGFLFATSTSKQEEIVDITKLIRYYAKKYGANAELALNIACAESCTRDRKTNEIYIHPTAKNPASTASGVFQFIRGTWKSVCSGDVMNPEDNVKCGVKLLAAGDVWHWNASKNQGFGGGWKNNPYFKYDVTN